MPPELTYRKSDRKCKKILDEVKTKNPYPEDIFTKPTKEEYKQVKRLFKGAGLIQDKFFGSFGRMVWNNCIDSIKKAMIENVEHQTHEKERRFPEKIPRTPR